MKINRVKTNSILNVNENEGVTYLTFPLLSKYENFIHAFSTRLGGVSTGIYESMNLSFSRGDDKKCVEENFRRFAKATGIDYDSFVLSDQTHTTNIRIIDINDRGNGLTRPRNFFETDALITNTPGVTLCTSYADCVPLYFIDPVNKAIGLAHSGWKGTVGRIGAKTIAKMIESFGSNPSQIVCAIGPSICASCYEVSEDVAMEFSREFGNKSTEIIFTQSDYYIKHSIEREALADKYQLDLWQANKIILLEAGIREENLAVTDICTCCNPDFLYSHRASHGQRGNLAAILAIK